MNGESGLLRHIDRCGLSRRADIPLATLRQTAHTRAGQMAVRACGQGLENSGPFISRKIARRALQFGHSGWDRLGGMFDELAHLGPAVGTRRDNDPERIGYFRRWRHAADQLRIELRQCTPFRLPPPH